MDNEQDDVQDAMLYPAWKQAFSLFKEAGFIWGDTVPHEWFYEAFGLVMPPPTMPIGDAERVKMQHLQNFTRLRSALLDQRQMDLVSVTGVGYEIVHPRDQSRRAYRDGLHDIRRAIRTTAERISHVNAGMLTADERREHADLAAKTAQLGLMLRSARRLPLSSTDDE